MQVVYIRPKNSDIKSPFFKELENDSNINVFEIYNHQDISDSIKNIYENNKITSIVIDGQCKDKFKIIASLRDIRELILTPIYIETEQEKWRNSCDGLIDSLQDINELNNKIISKLNKLQNIEIFNQDDFFLAYLYTRKNLAHLTPKLNENKDQLYQYLILDIFYQNLTDYLGFLLHLIKEKKIEKNELVDKVHCCPECLSGHLKFTEICPSCGSIDIENKSFLHCFTCGLMAPEEEFMKTNNLECPKCLTKLLHIGEDYDRPLESGLCNNCTNYYVESGTRASCLKCNAKFSSEEIIVRYVYNLEISDLEIKRLISTDYSPLDDLRKEFQIKEESLFIDQLDWFIQYQKRYEKNNFSLLSFTIEKNTTQDETLIKQNLLDAKQICDNLKSVLRTTDIITQIDKGNIWIILPNTDQKGLEIAYKKILEKISNPDKYKIKKFFSTKDSIKDLTAKTLINIVRGDG